MTTHSSAVPEVIEVKDESRRTGGGDKCSPSKFDMSKYHSKVRLLFEIGRRGQANELLLQGQRAGCVTPWIR